jgi:hypothetical protein
MSLFLRYNDVYGLNIYTLIFNSFTTALNNNSSGFLTYSDNLINQFIFNIPELVNNSGMYATGINQTALNSGSILDLFIYQRTGASPSKASDILKGVMTVNWNGSRDAFFTHPPQLLGGSDLGTFNVGAAIRYNVEAMNIFGTRGPTDDNLVTWSMFGSSGTIITTGYIAGIIAENSGYLYTSNITTSGLSAGNYRIENSGRVNEEVVRTNFYFIASTGFVVNANVTADILGPLGYGTGYINDPSATALQFTTTLPSTSNGFYNGQILRPTSGPLVGVGRIVSDYIGSTKTVLLNKALSSIPSSGTSIVIFPLGGELNVS